MIQEITSSKFNEIISDGNVPSNLIDNITVNSNDEKYLYQIKNLKINDPNLETVNLYFHNFKFINVEIGDLTYTSKPKSGKKLVVAFVHFINCKIDTLEVNDNYSTTVKIEGDNIINKFTARGGLKSLNIGSDNTTTISSISILPGDEARDAESFTEISLHAIAMGGLCIDSLRIAEPMFDMTSLRTCYKYVSIDCHTNAEINSIDDRVARLEFGDFEGRFVTRKSKIGAIIFPYNVFKTAKFIFRSTFIDVCIISSSCKLNQVSFEQGCEIGKVFLLCGEIEGIDFKGCNIDVLYIDLARFKFNLLAISGTFSSNTHVNHLIFNRGVFESKMLLENFSISRLSFVSIINKEDIFISDIKYKQLVEVKNPCLVDISEVLHKYSFIVGDAKKDEQKAGYSQVIDMEMNGVLEIFNSDLGKINFISCDFSDMKLNFKASKITDIFLSGSDMPEQLVGNYQDRQVGYAQLKKVYDNRGDSVKSNDYLARELDAHYQSLKTENLKKENPAFKEKTWTQWFDYVTLKIHKNSNNFGTSWKTSLWWVLLGSLPLYLAYAWSIGYVPTWPWHDNAMHYGWEISSFFLEFLFPIHKADFIPEAVDLKPNSFSRILESLSRLLNGYIIYQFIAAFRKYGKK